MRSLLFLSRLVFIALLFSSCAIRSNLNVPAGQEFILGGNGRFQVKVVNPGPGSIEIQEELASGERVSVGELAPETKAKQTFSAGSAAVLRNPSAFDTRLRVKITGSLSLGMTYEDLGEER